MTDKLAIIVPYRDRQEHLDVFVPHMREFLKDKGIDYTIFIVEQSDDRPFNYGKLCNAAVKEISEEYTYFAFHDIDMLPINDECDYTWPEVPLHLATNVEAHEEKLPYPQYFGGVVLINREDFEDVNGYSNEYYGYGFEDLDLLYRIERAGLPLETFYDKNKTYSNYDELDVLPYRIENVELSRNPIIQKIKTISLTKENYLYGSLNPLGKTVPTKSFSVSFWFNDRFPRETTKNLFCFEGYNSGLFLNNGNQIIGQLWNTENKHTQVVSNYSRNVWNHIIFEYDAKENQISLTLNNKRISKESLPNDFVLYDYTNKHIKISDVNSDIELSEIFVFDTILDASAKKELYFEGSNCLNDLKTRFGLEPVFYFDYTKSYSRNLLLDKGLFLNHLAIKGKIEISETEIHLADKIYIPSRLEGQYKSLVHDNDTNIINRYYTYNPDILENSDIFFHEVITGELDYKTIGLSNIKYTLLDKLKRDGYELVRIVT
jgi:hypothetical protein